LTGNQFRRTMPLEMSGFVQTTELGIPVLDLYFILKIEP
jgi:hypothetical protein